MRHYCVISLSFVFFFFFFNDPAPSEIYTLSLHDALPIFPLIVGGVLYVVVAGFLVAAVCGYMAGLIGSSNSPVSRSEEHTSELQSHSDLVCRLLLEKKKYKNKQ